MEERRKVKYVVRCTLTVPVETTVPADWTEGDLRFSIEENSCPGTGKVGAAIEQAIEDWETTSSCWGCRFWGENEIQSIEWGEKE